MEQVENCNDGFTLRELTHADLEQFNALLRYAFQVTPDDLIRSGWQADEFKHAKAPILDGAYVLGWFHKGRLASQIVVYPMQVNIQGNIYAMGGVTGVTTYPEYSGRGLIHALVVKILSVMRERGSDARACPFRIPQLGLRESRPPRTAGRRLRPSGPREVRRPCG